MSLSKAARLLLALCGALAICLVLAGCEGGSGHGGAGQSGAGRSGGLAPQHAEAPGGARPPDAGGGEAPGGGNPPGGGGGPGGEAPGTPIKVPELSQPPVETASVESLTSELLSLLRPECEAAGLGADCVRIQTSQEPISGKTACDVDHVSPAPGVTVGPDRTIYIVTGSAPCLGPGDTGGPTPGPDQSTPSPDQTPPGPDQNPPSPTDQGSPGSGP